MTPSWSSLPDPLPLVEHLQPLELPALAFGLVVQARVLDRDRGLGREDHEHAFVLLVEHLGALLVGQVDVPEDGPSPDDPSAQERGHRRVVRREPHRSRVRADVGDPQRALFAGEGSEQAVAGGRVPERRSFLGRDPDGDEVLDRPAVRRQHAERSVPCAREVHGELDDPLEHRVERELRGEGHAGLDQAAIPVAGGVPPGHGPSVAEVARGAALQRSIPARSRRVPAEAGSFGP